MDNRNIRNGVRVRRAVYIPFELAQRVDALVSKGSTTSNVVRVALQRSLATIEKQVESGREIPGLKINTK